MSRDERDMIIRMQSGPPRAHRRVVEKAKADSECLQHKGCGIVENFND